MTDIITDTTAYVTGSKESLIKLLNRVLRVTGSEKATVSVDDSLESINVKIEQAKESMAKYNAEFTLIDFLDDRNRMNSPYKDYVLSYIDEEEPDGCEDYGVVLTNAQTKGDDYTIQIASHVHEAQGSYSSRDWDDWCEGWFVYMAAGLSLPRNMPMAIRLQARISFAGTMQRSSRRTAMPLI